MVKRLRFGLTGTGVFGNYHANKCAQNPRIDFIGVYDSNDQTAKETARKYGVTAFATYEDMLQDVEAVIIASAAPYHGSQALLALKAGRHCLIEKPIAATLEAAQQILDLSKRNGLTVQVGHQERFVVGAIGLADIPETPMKIQASRMGTYTERGTDVSVTLDLMIHDLDLILWLMGEFPQKTVSTAKIERSDSADVSQARLQFTHGYAEVLASRVADDFKRVMNIEYPSGTVKIDFASRTLVHDTPFDLNIDFATDPIARDSLNAATESFVESILQAKPAAITAQSGFDALRLALMIDADADKGSV